MLVSRRFTIVNVEEAKEDTEIYTFYGLDIAKKGELVVRYADGHKESHTKQYLAENYVHVDKLKMALGYEAMGEINLEEANAGVHTYQDGMFK